MARVGANVPSAPVKQKTLLPASCSLKGVREGNVKSALVANNSYAQNNRTENGTQNHSLASESHCSLKLRDVMGIRAGTSI